jgi:hypothetical protein
MTIHVQLRTIVLLLALMLDGGAPLAQRADGTR